MNPLRLRAQNYRSFPDLDLELPTGCIAVLGENGAGKSSLVNAIDLAIFGQRSLADTLSDTAPDDDLLLELELEHAGSVYRIRRTFSPRGRGKTTLDFEAQPDIVMEWQPLTRASAKETQDLIEQTLGLSRETFRASAFLAQGDGAAFSEAQPRDRKRILAEVLGLDRYDTLLQCARAELHTTQQRSAVVRSGIENAERELAERSGLELLLDQSKERERTARASLEECSARLLQARDRLSALREAAGLREAVERTRAIAERSEVSLRERISGLEWEIREQHDARLAERPALEVLAEGLPGLLRERERIDEQGQQFLERQRLERDHSRLSAEAEALRARFDALMVKRAAVLDGIGSETCDRCQQVLGADAAHRAAESYAAEAEELSFRANNIEEQDLVTLNEKISPLPPDPPDRERAAHVHDLIQQGQNAQQRLAALAEVEASRERADQELQKVRAELPEREKAVAAARAEFDALGPHDPAAAQQAEREAVRLYESEQQMTRDLRTLDQEIARLDERLQRLSSIAAELKKLRTEDESLRAETDVLVQLERAFSPNGIPALIVENGAIPYLETEATRILGALGTSYQVELRTQAALKSGDGVRDTLDVIVIGDHGERPYETFSGGERTRINLALRIALARLLAHRRGAESRLLAIDEPEFLDEQGTSALVQVLRELEGDFDRLYLISHVPALRDAFDQVLTVVKDETGSRVTDGYEAALEPVIA